MDFKDITEFEDQVVFYIRAGVQAMNVVIGGQGASVEQTLKGIAARAGHQIVFWDCLYGWDGSKNYTNFVEAVTIITDAVTRVKENEERVAKGQRPIRETDDTPKDPFPAKNTIMVMRDPHHELANNAGAIAAVKLAIQKGAFNTMIGVRPLILLTPDDTLNPEIAVYMKRLDYPKPSQRQRLEIFDSIRGSMSAVRRQCPEDLRAQIGYAGAGMGGVQLMDTYSEAIIRHNGITPDIIETIEAEKGRLLKRSATLTYVSKAEINKAGELGGYGELKRWLTERSVAYSPEAERIGLDYPKGISIIGVPGTGKSKFAAEVARILKLPLVSFHFDAVFSSLLGDSEKNSREAMQTVDALEGSVLLIDEVDKALGGINDASGDGGVAKRIFGSMLSWMSSKRNKTFVVMTMNRINGVPPELLRKGRLDEIFFVDMPDEEERRAIFDIHMKQRTIDPNTYSASEWVDMLAASKGYVGAEIEQGVISARFASYSTDTSRMGVPTAKQVIEALHEMMPITKLDPENIAAIRKFGNDRARSVSSVRKTSKGRASRTLDVEMPFDNSN